MKAKIVAQYYQDNAKKLHSIVNGILKQFSGINQMDYDDYYSLANEVFWIAVKDFNGTGDFNGFLYMRLSNKIKSLVSFKNCPKRSDVEIIRDKNGEIRKVFHPTISIDSHVKINDQNIPLSDLLASDCNVEQQWLDNHEIFSEKVEQYLQMLPRTTKQVMLLVSDGWKPAEIIYRLHITAAEYNDHLKIAKSYEAEKVLM